MIINTRGVELSDSTYINKEGKFLFKIEKFELDGVTSSGDAKFKLHFKGTEIIEGKATKEPLYLHSEQFNVGQKSLWRIKQVEVALKAPEIYDINDFIGRYIVANIKSENYPKNDGTTGTAYKVKSWEYCTANDKLPPIQEAKQNENNGNVGVVEEDADMSELPF